MAHIVIEHSANLDADIGALVARLHEAALATGVFPIGGLRTRALPLQQYRIADGDPANAFVHVTVRMGHGRDLATRERVGEELFAALRDAMDPLFQRSPLALSLELQEIDPKLSFKHNNLHDHVAHRDTGS